MIICFVAGWLISPAGVSGSGPAPFRIEQVSLARLGKEHIATAVWRRTARGGRVVAWGNRVLEWQLGRSPVQREVVPAREGVEYSNGGCAMDVDGDGIEEIVVARIDGRNDEAVDLLWLKGRPGQHHWKEHPVARLTKRAWAAPHDIRPLTGRDASGKPWHGVVLTLDNQKLVWFRIPQNPAEPWERREIAVLTGGPQWGVAVGDIAGHRRPDVVCGQYWAECPADPLRDPWIVRRYNGWENGEWSGMAQTALADFDGDGRLEIVATEAEIPGGRLGIFRRDPSRPGGLWECYLIEKDLYCPHSLALSDLNSDGKPDLIAGEMKAGGWDFPMRSNPRIYAYLNRGSQPFERHILAEGCGVHQLSTVPGGRKGRVQFFAADEIQPYKFPEMTTPISLWSVSWMPGQAP
ncbi:MAG: VCBS repeat-containing protein [Armatimonadetes bacterium]|nr:VCBS repeat-containing protein [Armatimonadota bacterium]